jgi:hypothetical protein
MKKIQVSSGDLRMIMSLLREYMGQEEPTSHFRDTQGKLPDASYFTAIDRLQKELAKQDPQGDDDPGLGGGRDTIID